MSEINSNLINLQEVVEKNYFFNIPIYQRLYVWEDAQINTLMEDISTAFEDGKEIFFLGGVLVVENEDMDNGTIFDLIDGQQRFTTLWMIAMVLMGELQPFVQRPERDVNRHRVNFAIRPDIHDFFKEYITTGTIGKSTDHLENAIALLESFKKKFETEREGKSADIAAYIFKKVKLIFTQVPKETDLNKLFEIINNRGVQLQHHEILKARLLSKIDEEERYRYAVLWDACSYMEGFVEKNLKDIGKVRIQDFFDNDSAKNNEEHLYKPKIVLDALAKGYTEKPILSLMDILTSNDDYQVDEDGDDNDYESEEVRSIITFPMLLQHTLRIFLHDKDGSLDLPKILDKELLGLFSDSFLKKFDNKEDIMTFFQLLWQARYAFDKYVIKWVKQDEVESHFICKLEKYQNKNKWYLRRRANSNDAMMMLQSMLYHSQQITTHYWLTPFLNFVLKNKEENYLAYMRHLDNHLLSSDEAESESLIKRTKSFLHEPMRVANISTTILTNYLGTSFPHYWFYKLEFILWDKYNDSKDSRWKEFKLTAKNSVEHISPQTQKSTDTNTVTEAMLNKFGNLALVSRSINSEYSNLPFNEKRQRFKNNNAVKLDSLKMALIYEEHEVWGDDLALEHEVQMIKEINEYLGIDE